MVRLPWSLASRCRLAAVKVGAGMALLAGVIVAATLAAGAGGSTAAPSRVIQVHPGLNAITKAIHQASAGDTLRIHAGTYHEALTIDKPLRLKAAGDIGPHIVDAGCKANDAIHVTSGGVVIYGLSVKGAGSGFGDYPAEIFFDQTRSGRAAYDHVIDSCDAEYGISAFNTGPVKVTENEARDFSDSGIYIGSISNTYGRPLIVGHNGADFNSRGIIVEDSNGPSTRIVITHNGMGANRIAGDEGPSDGLYLTNSDHVKILHNLAKGNTGSGFHADKNSDHNLFKNNVAVRNGAGKLLDEGRGNCGRRNNFPLPHC